MIVGNGVLANALKKVDCNDWLLFASGVSNSLENRESEFQRETALLKDSMKKYAEKKIFYFSTCSIYDYSKKNSPYVQHKLKTENFIQETSDNYLIIRVGNAVGNGGNPNTLFNFLKTKIKNQERFLLYTKAKRILVDVDDIGDFVNKKGGNMHNCIQNLAFPHQYSLREIIAEMVRHQNLEAIYDEIDEGDYYHVDFDEILNGFFGDNSPQDYLKKIVSKYF